MRSGWHTWPGLLVPEEKVPKILPSGDGGPGGSDHCKYLTITSWFFKENALMMMSKKVGIALCDKMLKLWLSEMVGIDNSWSRIYFSWNSLWLMIQNAVIWLVNTFLSAGKDMCTPSRFVNKSMHMVPWLFFFIHTPPDRSKDVQILTLAYWRM